MTNESNHSVPPAVERAEYGGKHHNPSLFASFPYVYSQDERDVIQSVPNSADNRFMEFCVSASGGYIWRIGTRGWKPRSVPMLIFVIHFILCFWVQPPPILMLHLVFYVLC